MEKIVILCGGKGTRLRPLTKKVPKPLVPLNGKPILEYLMNLCAKQGYTDFIICTGYKAGLVEKTVKEFVSKDWNVKFVNSGEKASILDRIIDASEYCGEKFAVCYGDAIADINFRELLNFNAKNNTLITMSLYQMQSPFGLIETEGNKVTAFKEKPVLPFWFNIGFFAFEKKILIGAKGKDWVKFLEENASKGNISAMKHEGEHLTFNTEHEKAEAEKKISVFTHVYE